MYDFHLFYEGGRAVLMGLSPSAIYDFNGPYPLAVLFAPLALFPEPVAYVIFLLINLVLLWLVMRKRAVWALLAFPVLFTLFVGQVDLLLALAIPLGAPWTLPLTLVKPQVGFVVLPWLLRRLDRKGWLKAGLVGAAFLGLCFLLRPTWVAEWLARQPGLASYSVHTSNILWLVPDQGSLRSILTVALGLAALPAGFLLSNKCDSWAVLQVFQPLTNIYSASVLAEWFGPLEVLLSWLAVIVVGGNIHAGMPMFILPLGILGRAYWQKRAANKEVHSNN